jgi:hypothetical protein
VNLPQPKCRIEVFPAPGFFDDNFVKGWTVVSGSFSTDGECGKITGWTAVGRIEKNVPNLNSSVYTWIQVRVKRVSGTNTTWGVQVYAGGSWYVIFTGETGTGLRETGIPANLTITKIALLEEYAGDISNFVEFDYVAICKNLVLTPVTETLSVADAIESLEITLPILSRGLAGAKFKLPNFNSQYTGKVNEHDIVLIWLYRTGESFTKVFGGRVSKVTYEGIAGAPEYYIHVECMDHGWEMQVPPALVQKAYSSTNGKTIIKDAVAVCNYLSDYGVDQDNAIASTHSYVFDEKTPWNVIREVADACQTSGGAVGFDGYVDPAGNLWIFARGANNSTVDLTDKIIRYKVEYDTYRVKNKIKVYGKAECPWSGSVSKDGWTESASGWYSNVTVSTSPVTKVLGSCSVVAYGPATYVELYRTFSPIKIGPMKNQYKVLRFYIMLDTGGGSITGLEVRVGADSNNYFFYTFEAPKLAEWEEREIQLGPDSDVAGSVGNPSWDNIAWIYFKATFSTSADLVMRIDALYFGNRCFEGSAEDSTSQSLYGVRMLEPTVDNSLTSNDDCTKKAQSLLAYYKHKVTTLKVETFGNNAFRPGDMQNITLSNDNISGSFRILEITHTLEDVFWKTDLLMSNEPIMIDYIFRSMFQKQKQLETNV